MKFLIKFCIFIYLAWTRCSNARLFRILHLTPPTWHSSNKARAVDDVLNSEPSHPHEFVYD